MVMQFSLRNDAEYQNTASLSGTGTSGRTWIAKHAGDLGNSFKTSICVATRANTQVQDNIVSFHRIPILQLKVHLRLHLMELFLQQLHLLEESMVN